MPFRTAQSAGCVSGAFFNGGISPMVRNLFQKPRRFFPSVKARAPQKLQELRIEKIGSQEQFAKILRMNARTIRRAEQGKTIRVDNAEAIAKALKEPITELFVLPPNIRSRPNTPEPTDVGPREGESGPSVSEFVVARFQRLIAAIEQAPSLNDLQMKELIKRTLTGRDQLLRPVSAFLLSVLEDAQKRPSTIPRNEVLTAAKRFVADRQNAQQEIVKRVCHTLQNSTGLVDVVVVADFSSLIANSLRQLAIQNPQKHKSIEICLVVSGGDFNIHADTVRWKKEFQKENMARFYKFGQEIPFENVASDFDQIGQKNQRIIFLMGTERVYPNGQILDWWGMGRIIRAANMHGIDVLVAAECYKVQPLLAKEVEREGVSMDSRPTELTLIEIGPRVGFISDHAPHTSNHEASRVNEPLKCCYRFWRNKMEGKNYPIAVIFDLDGTILDSEEVHKFLYQQAARTLGYELTDAVYFSQLRGMTDEETFEHILRLAGKKLSVSKLVEDKKQRFLRHLIENRIKPIAGVVEYIYTLERRGHMLALATSAFKEEATAALGNLKLTKSFQVITTCEDVVVGKPAPEVYEKTLQALRLHPSECLVHEDSIAGIRAAVAAGIRVVAIGDISDKKLKQARASAVIPNFLNYELPESYVEQNVERVESHS